MNGSYNVIKVIITNGCPLVGNGHIVLPHTSFYGSLTHTEGSGHAGYDRQNVAAAPVESRTSDDLPF